VGAAQKTRQGEFSVRKKGVETWYGTDRRAPAKPANAIQKGAFMGIAEQPHNGERDQ